MKKKIFFEYISMHFYAFEPRTLWPGATLGPRDLGLNKLGKGSPGNATDQISST